MTANELLALIQSNPGYVAAGVAYAGTYLHKYLGKYPVAQVLVKYANLVPIVKLIALDVATVIVATYGPELATIEADVAPKPAPVVQRQEMKAAAPVAMPSVQTSSDKAVPPYG